MAKGRFRLAKTIVVCAVLLSLCRIETAHSFIQREYTIQEILDACSNVAFGKTESVDAKKQRVIVKLTENLKGKSDLSHVRINVAVGQVKKNQTSPAMLMKKFKVGLPVILFYEKAGSKLNGLGYVSGTWFQIFGTDNKDKKRVWWNFTHLEVYMHRTFKGSTEQLQKVVRAALSGKKWASAGKNDVRVLVLMGNGAPPASSGSARPGPITATAEFLMLGKFSKVGKWKIAYQETKDRNLSGIHDAHILWIGVDELGMNGYRLNKKAEDRIKSFVRRGGVVIVSSQDNDPPDKLCGTGWIPEAIKGVEEDARRDFEPTKHAGDIFKSPRSVKSGTLRFDDTWTGWSSKYRILATTNAGKSIALAALQYGKGMYLLTALSNESGAFVNDNAPLMENIIHYSVKWLKSSSGKDVRVLVLTGNGAPPVQGDASSVGTTKATAEFLALRKFSKVGKWKVAYQETKDRNLPGLHDAHILWIGVDELGMDGYHLNKKAEDKIKSFVQGGGVVIVSSQDSDANKLCGTGWIPKPIKGVEEDARRDFKTTKYAGDIFKSPRSVKSGTVRFDDTWTGWSGDYEALATTNAGKSIALATLRSGKGMYLLTALSNESGAFVDDNAPLMENIIHYSVKWLKSSSGRDIS